MVKGIACRVRQAVGVEATFTEDGRVLPREVVWEDGRRFCVDEVRDVRRASSLKVGGDGIRYTVRIGHAVTYLFRDGDAWFVERKVPE